MRESINRLQLKKPHKKIIYKEQSECTGILQLHTENMEEAKKLGINKMKELLKDKIEKFQKAIEQLEN